jgi:hypothetical protein
VDLFADDAARRERPVGVAGRGSVRTLICMCPCTVVATGVTLVSPPAQRNSRLPRGDAALAAQASTAAR